MPSCEQTIHAILANGQKINMSFAIHKETGRGKWKHNYEKIALLVFQLLYLEWSSWRFLCLSEESSKRTIHGIKLAVSNDNLQNNQSINETREYKMHVLSHSTSCFGLIPWAWKERGPNIEVKRAQNLVSIYGRVLLRPLVSCFGKTSFWLAW